MPTASVTTINLLKGKTMTDTLSTTAQIEGKAMTFSTRANNLMIHENCPVCLEDHKDADIPYWIIFDGHHVCRACAGRYAPLLLKAIEAMNEAEAREDALDDWIKQEKLKHYATAPPCEFIQFDVFTGWNGDDTADCEGDAVFSGHTIELMRSKPAVRVLVMPKTPGETAVCALTKIIEWINRTPALLTEECERTRMKSLRESSMRKTSSDGIPF
jgi:hypothetical protein